MTLLSQLGNEIRAWFGVTPEQLSSSARKTRAVVRQRADKLEEIMTEGFARLDAAATGIQGDLDGLKAANADVQAKLDAALEGVEEGKAEAVRAALADFTTQLNAAADRFEGIDAQTPAVEPAPEPTPEPQPEPAPPVEEPAPVEPAPVDPDAA